MTVILLDSGPLSLLSSPKATPDTLAAFRWLTDLLNAGAEVILPEIADYEVRRELLRADKHAGLARLDELADLLVFLRLASPAMRLAAELWARARQQGQPTTPDLALDCDVILAAQALTFGAPREDVVVATTNVKHLALFVQAMDWRQITA